MATNLCSVMQGLANYELQAIQALNKKFIALQRLAYLLEQAGETLPLPDISGLVPVLSINLEAYTNLQKSCPFLNLPPYTPASLNSLQSIISAAYSSLLAQFKNHPWLRMNSIQKLLNQFQNNLNFAFGNDYLGCLNAICNAVGTADSLLSSVTPASVTNTLSAFSNNFVTNAGQVLSPAQLAKSNSVVQAYNQVQALQSATVTDYQAATAGGGLIPPVPSAVPTAVTSPNFKYTSSLSVSYSS